MSEGKTTMMAVFLISVMAMLTVLIPGISGKDPEWRGTDDIAVNRIDEISDYKPWFSSIWKPETGEMERLLFSLQAAIGAGITGYIAGYYSGMKQRKKGD